MKLRFKHQKFQAEAANAVCDVFSGQPYLTPTYMIDQGIEKGGQTVIVQAGEHTGIRNEPIRLTDEVILENIRRIQRANQIIPSEKLEGRYNLTVEMETGVGKTYTYIKTMYELNKRYGWSKFIIVVPSVAIREGVYKSFQITEEHFSEDYSKKIRYFIYDSSRLTEIDRFASDSAINAMIINSQAFNARGKEARRMYMKLDSFRSRRPIDIIARTNPILIIDEPQSVEGPATRERLKDFNALVTLRYSATPKDPYNMIYRLDALDAYNKKLVKKIAVKGISVTGSTATEGYLYLQGIVLSRDKPPAALLEFDFKGEKSTRKVIRKVTEGFNLYDHSNGLEEYRAGYTVARIDGRDNSLTFINGRKIFVGDVVGKVQESQLRRIQIRETILSHIECERSLFRKGIKVLSLFFIDEVAKYKQYDEAGNPLNGEYANAFEEEYKEIIEGLQLEFGDEDYIKYLNSIPAERTHAGYFSIDKDRRTGKERFVNSALERGTTESNDSDAYDLIMRNKERLLDMKEPVRFIFSHSALREGWDNPNVFQICTLKHSDASIRKRQEVGRGLRLCVNQHGERMDANVLGEDVHTLNVLTVVADESYDSFTRALQGELAEAVAHRPKMVEPRLFVGKTISDAEGHEHVIDEVTAHSIYESLIVNGYVKSGQLTDKYFEDKKYGKLAIADEVKNYTGSIMHILDSVYDESLMKPENARNNVELHIDENKLSKKEFQTLWSRINSKSAYVVDFDTDELIQIAIQALNRELHVPQVFFRIERGVMETIESREALQNALAFEKPENQHEKVNIAASNAVKFDLVGRLVEETGLTRFAIVQILKGIEPLVFEQFKLNPEEFIIRASAIINEQKATVIVEHIAYNKLSEAFETRIFTEPTMKGRLGENAKATSKHLYDYVLYDSPNELEFVEKLDKSHDVSVYVKLPSGFFISTPVGKYNPDWAIAFYEGKVKHIYFVAETKGSMSSMQLRLIEKAKVECARAHFKAISSDTVKYEVVSDYDSLMNLVMQ